MAKDTPHFPTAQQLDEAVKKGMENERKLRARMATPEWREHEEKLRQATPAKLGQSAKPVPRKKPVRRKKGAGRKRSLTPKQIAHGQKIFRRELKKDRTLKKKKQMAMLDHLRPLLEFGVSDSTLLRDIVRPVLSK